MNLNDITLSEISQSQEDKYCITSLIHEIVKKKAKFIEEESRIARDEGVEGMGGCWSKGTNFQL